MFSYLSTSFIACNAPVAHTGPTSHDPQHIILHMSDRTLLFLPSSPAPTLKNACTQHISTMFVRVLGCLWGPSDHPAQALGNSLHLNFGFTWEQTSLELLVVLSMPGTDLHLWAQRSAGECPEILSGMPLAAKYHQHASTWYSDGEQRHSFKSRRVCTFCWLT